MVSHLKRRSKPLDQKAFGDEREKTGVLNPRTALWHKNFRVNVTKLSGLLTVCDWKYPRVYRVSIGLTHTAAMEPFDYPFAVSIDADIEQISFFTAYQTFRNQTQDVFHTHRQEIFLFGP